MRDYEEEAALLGALAEDLRGFRHLVTYNGRDVRHPVARVALSALPHALPAGARVPTSTCWRRPAGCGRSGSCPAGCRASSGRCSRYDRHEDVPGDEIPRIYFDYVRRRDGRALRARARAQPARRGLAGRARRAGERVGARGPRRGPARRVQPRPRARGRGCCTSGRRRCTGACSTRRTGRCASRRWCAWPRARSARGDHEAALPACGARRRPRGSARGWRELAVHHEHRGRDLPAALAAADKGLRSVDGATSARLAADLQRRRARLLRRVSA